MNREVTMLLLKQAFGGTADERRVVARTAGDLADSGRYRQDNGAAVTPQLIVDELSDAPDDHGLVERWNWWMRALDVAYGGYRDLLVRQVPGD
jgi:hypothetical protein